MPIDRDLIFFEKARARYKEASEFWRPIYDEFDTDLRYATGDQWDETIKNARENLQGRPTLTFDVLHTNCQLVENGIRQGRPAIKIGAAGSGATKEGADIRAGIIRHWNYMSQGDIARDNAVGYAVKGSFGFYRVGTKYVNENPEPDDADAFDQDGTIDWIRDPKTVLWDKAALEEPDFSSGNYCFVTHRLGWDEYKDDYGDRSDQSWTSWDQNDSSLKEWANEDSIQICEYFYFTQTSKTVTVGKKTRTVMVRECHQDFMNGVEVLSETTFPVAEIPIIPVLGEQTVVEGKTKLASLIRYVRDAARLRNAYKSGTAENIGLTNRVPYLGPRGMFKSASWMDAHLKNPAYLEWDPVYAKDGSTPLAPNGPTRQNAEAAIQALTAAAAVEADDIKAGMGIYDSSLGAAKAEYSGVSVKARTEQADVTNFHFADNLAKVAMWKEGRILLALIEEIVDTPRIMHMMNEVGETSEVLIEALHEDGTLKRVPGREQEQHHRLDVGRYVVTTGPGYESQADEEYETWMQFLAQAPELAPAFLPVILKWSNTPGSDLLAKVAAAVAPPAVQAVLNGQQAPDPQVQAQLAQVGQQLQEAQAKILQLEFDKKAETQKLQAQHLTDIENNAVKIAIAEIQSKNKQDIAVVTAEMDAIKQKLEMWQGHAEVAQQHEHDMQMQQRQASTQADQQASDQAHQQGMQGAQLAAQAQQPEAAQ